MNTQRKTRIAPAYELRFNDDDEGDPQFAFPCDRTGRVDLDRLGERARNDYLFARVLMKHRTVAVLGTAKSR